MTSVLYSLRSEIDADGRTAYRITKFTDGEVESSYHTSREQCDCPAGVRPSCRHRQMLPQMLNADIANTHWFWSHDDGQVCDFQGIRKSFVEEVERASGLLAPAEPANSPAIPDTPQQQRHPWRRL